MLRVTILYLHLTTRRREVRPPWRVGLAGGASELHCTPLLLHYVVARAVVLRDDLQPVTFTGALRFGLFVRQHGNLLFGTLVYRDICCGLVGLGTAGRLDI